MRMREDVELTKRQVARRFDRRCPCALAVRRVAHETTRVRFAEMSESEIDWYIASGEPVGKAGAYGIQGRASLFIEEIEGDYFNIMGLPIRLVYELATKV